MQARNAFANVFVSTLPHVRCYARNEAALSVKTGVFLYLPRCIGDA